MTDMHSASQIPRVVRVFSKAMNNLRTQNAEASWETKDVCNLPIADEMLTRSQNGLPFIRDLLDLGAQRCDSDDDIILYTNHDIGVVSGSIHFPGENFFIVRKNVTAIGSFTQDDLAAIPFEPSINADAIGVTRKWWLENRDSIPDFVIGRPYWDLCFILLIDGVRLENIIYHVAHDSIWKSLHDDASEHNKASFLDYLKRNSIPICNSSYSELVFHKFVDYMRRYGFNCIENPVFISFFTESHRELFGQYFLPSFRRVFGYKYRLVFREHEQHCAAGSFHTRGWRLTQAEKLSFVIEQLDTLKDDQVFIFCDADILHVSDYVEIICQKLKRAELVAQSSFKGRNICSEQCRCSPSRAQIVDSICSGFYAARKTAKISTLLKKVLSDLLSDLGNEKTADQYFLNRNKDQVRFEILDETFFNPGYSSVGKVIDKMEFANNLLSSPRNAALVHANWMVGCEAKSAYMDHFLYARSSRHEFSPSIKLVAMTQSIYDRDIEHMTRNSNIEFFVFHAGGNRCVQNVHLLKSPSGLDVCNAGEIRKIIGPSTNYGVFDPSITFLDINWLLSRACSYDIITQYFHCLHGVIDRNLLILRDVGSNLSLLENLDDLPGSVRAYGLSVLCTRISNRGCRKNIRLYDPSAWSVAPQALALRRDVGSEADSGKINALRQQLLASR